MKPLIYHFHQSLKERNKGRQLQPTSIFNFDEVISFVGFWIVNCRKVPLPFVNDCDRRTLDDTGAERVWVRQPGSGLEKRQATLFLCIAAGDNQPMPHVIFRGSGSQVMKSAEAEQWVKRVKVHFQQCAWVDTKTAVNIAQAMKSDPAFAYDDPERVFFCDNLDAHKASEFVNTMKPLGDLLFFPPNVTDMLQPGK